MTYVLRFVVTILTVLVAVYSFSKGFKPLDTIHLVGDQVLPYFIGVLSFITVSMFVVSVRHNINVHSKQIEWSTVIYEIFCFLVVLTPVGIGIYHILTAVYTPDIQNVIWTIGNLLLCLMGLSFCLNMLAYGTLIKPEHAR